VVIKKGVAMYYYRRLPAFEYVAPKSVEETASFLQAHSEETRVMAGGTMVLHRMKERIGVKKYLMSLKSISGLDTIAAGGSRLTLGAMLCHQAIADAPVVRKAAGVLSLACARLGTPQIRAMGTLGGNVACNLSTAETVPVLMALGADVTLVSAKGKRTVPVEEIYKEINEGEFVTEIIVPIIKPQSWGYEKLATRERFDYATVSAAVTMTTSGRLCQDVRIAVGGVTLPTRRARRAEELLKGKSLNDKQIREAAKQAAQDARIGADIHISSEYKKELLAVVILRALRQSMDRIERMASRKGRRS
jgi:aerobic carbon-monoxide dehydrogenase medium subunit